MSITIDSTPYNIPFINIDRTAELLFKTAERSADGILHTELIGVYYNYELQMGMSANNVSDYIALWVKLTEAVESHEITLPDESGDKTFDCYFANIRDVLNQQRGGTNYMRNLSFTVIAISPAVTP